jgi:trehalose 6-phosphate phosphatase
MSQDLDVRQALAVGGGSAFPAVDLTRDAILLDVDGTLLDIAPTPEEVRVPESLQRTLRRMIAVTGGALALVSGRTLASIDELFAPLESAAIGCHGAQLRSSARAAIAMRARTIPESLRQAFADVSVLLPGVRIEDKTFTLAFHYRQARETEKALLLLLRNRLIPFERDYVLMAGKSIFEIKLKSRNKGEALLSLMRLAPFRGRRPIYLGDDTTDKYAFAILPELGGLGISVGRRMPHADFVVNAPQDVRRWLAMLVGPENEESNAPTARS